MKTSKRAKAVLIKAGYSGTENSPIAQLCAFAAQNSGLDFANYGDRRAYNQEARSISKDWHRFKNALIIAIGDGVTDAHILAEAPHAFSGRLEWKSEGDNAGHWAYCTGQYFPTEYRKAAATLLEYSTQQVRAARPAKVRKVSTISELRKLNEENGGCWFARSSMRFFNSRIESGIIRGKYFITSEQQEDNFPRKFTVRSFDAEGSIDTVGEFHSHGSKAAAMAAVPAE